MAIVNTPSVSATSTNGQAVTVPPVADKAPDLALTVTESKALNATELLAATVSKAWATAQRHTTRVIGQAINQGVDPLIARKSIVSAMGAEIKLGLAMASDVEFPEIAAYRKNRNK